ncbi:glutaredoxin family protein, partial [Rhizobiaceae sp. 2RAB30]
MRASTRQAIASAQFDPGFGTAKPAAPGVEIYSTPTCPDCLTLKLWLNSRGIPFLEHDLGDPAVAEEARRRTGVRVAPITVIDDKHIFYG